MSLGEPFSLFELVLEQMVSRENKVIVAFIALAVVLLYIVSAVTTLPTWGSAAIVIGVGVVIPVIINGYLDNRQE